jgi:hypothetical protein
VEAAERQGGLRDPPPCVAEERREAGSRERSLGRSDRIERERGAAGARASEGRGHSREWRRTLDEINWREENIQVRPIA